MAKKRRKWKLPKTFKPDKVKKGQVIRHDGEPRFYKLTKFVGDVTLRTDAFFQCCDCGLDHHHTFDVLKVHSGWYIVHRAYRVPNTGKKGK